jgi:putative ABC transport system permease protein
MYVTDPNIPLPAVASRRFVEKTGLRKGGEAELVMGKLILPVSIRGEAELFPSIGDDDPGFLLINQEHLYYFSGLAAQGQASGPNEAWLRLSEDPEQRTRALNEISDRFGIFAGQRIDINDVLKSVRSDPLIQAGGSGVLLIALVAAFSVLALGFSLSLYLGGQARTIEVSVMRAMGISSKQIVLMIGLEYLLVAAIGVVIGIVAGLRISETMLSFLNVTQEGARVVPPFSLATRWGVVGLALGATGLAFLGGIAALVVYFLRLPVSRVLRITR